MASIYQGFGAGRCPSILHDVNRKDFFKDARLPFAEGPYSHGRRRLLQTAMLDLPQTGGYK
jgi:hypothetical protein